jgi:hypothetical protein
MATKKMSVGKVAAQIGAGLLAAGAAGYYFYASPTAEKNRKIAAKWAGDMKREVVREAKRLKQVNAKDFAKVVDTVARTYAGVRSVNMQDVQRAARELKANWERVREEMNKGKSSTASRSTRTTKKTPAVQSRTRARPRGKATTSRARG